MDDSFPVAYEIKSVSDALDFIWEYILACSAELLFGTGLSFGTDEFGGSENERKAHLNEGGEEEDKKVCEEDAQLIGVGISCFF